MSFTGVIWANHHLLYNTESGPVTCIVCEFQLELHPVEFISDHQVVWNQINCQRLKDVTQCLWQDQVDCSWLWRIPTRGITWWRASELEYRGVQGNMPPHPGLHGSLLFPLFCIFMETCFSSCANFVVLFQPLWSSWITVFCIFMGMCYSFNANSVVFSYVKDT